MKIVTPFRPFVPESVSHLRLADFDWVDAIAMLRASAARHGVTVTTITDHDTELPGPAHQYTTAERRLMLWILEVSLCYLRSPDFDQDTVMLSPDTLVFGDLRPHFRADLGMIARLEPKYVKAGRTLLNAAQWWRHSAKAALVALFTEALAIARQLPEERLVWGADTDPFYTLLRPAQYGVCQRGDLSVCFIPMTAAFTTVTDAEIQRVARREPVSPRSAIVDFKYTRKLAMRAYFDATVGSAVLA